MEMHELQHLHKQAALRVDWGGSLHLQLAGIQTRMMDAYPVEMTKAENQVRLQVLQCCG